MPGVTFVSKSFSSPEADSGIIWPGINSMKFSLTELLTRHKISAKDYGKRFLKRVRGPWAGTRKGRDMFLVQVNAISYHSRIRGI